MICQDILDKYFPDSNTPCKIVLTGQGRHCKMEIAINYHGNYIRAEVSGDTMYYNIDTSVLEPNYVVDFGLPIKFPLTAVIGTNQESLVKNVLMNYYMNILIVLKV